MYMKDAWGRLALLLLLLQLIAANAFRASSKRCQQGCDFAVRQHPNGKLYAVHNPPLSSQQQLGPTPNIVWARYWATYEETGWDRIEISSLAAVPVPDSVKARAAGYAEGQLHWNRIADYWHNYKLNEFRTPGNHPTKELLDWIDAQDHFVRTHIQQHASTSQGQGVAGDEAEYWRLMGLVMDQFDGLCEGVWDNAAPDRNLTYHELYLLQSAGDLYDLKVLFPQVDESAEEAGDEEPGQAYGAEQRKADSDEDLVSTPGTVSGLDRAATANPLLGGVQQQGAAQPVGSGGQLGQGQDLEQGKGRAQEQQQGQRRRRAYYPGHGMVGPGGYGNGELLECSALIKVQPVEGTDNVGSTGRGAGSGGSDAARLAGGGGRAGATAGRAAGLQRGPEWLTRDDMSALGDSRKLKLPARPYLRTFGQEAGTETEGQGQEPAAGQGQSAGGSDGAGAVRPYSDFWAGHATWRPYYAMLRTWKTYQLPWAKSGPITVSSSPGFVAYSKDDWYTTDDFVIMETTNSVYNKSLYDLIQPNCALTWQRVQVANLGATSGAEWVSLFKRHNSGTYNNQWMVLDVHRLMKGHQSDVLWVMEQVPGSTEAADVTSTLLQQGFWPSYNVPYFPRIYNLSGWPADKDLHSSAPRALLFAREQQRVASTQDMQAVMRLNRYKTDPLSQGNPSWAIASRYDLPLASGAVANWTQRAFGAVDAKVVDWWSFKQQITYVINGPTSDDLPPFSWDRFCAGAGVAAGPNPSAAPGILARGAASVVRALPVSWRWAGLRGPEPCDSHVGLVDTFDFQWEGLQVSLPWFRRRRAL